MNKKNQYVSKYDDLNPNKELEQKLTQDLKKAFEKRCFTVKHNGTSNSHSPAGYPDIEMYDRNIHINIEVTKSVKSGQDREWQSIKDHFQVTKQNNPSKKCFLWFISPETHYRTKDSIIDWNYQHKNNNDQKIMPISFSTFELFIIKLIQTTKENYTKKEIIELFTEFTKFVDDESILRHFYEKLFSYDDSLKKSIEHKEGERHQQIVEELITGFTHLEQKLHDERIALSTNAIKTVIYLVFIKLYEEKKEKEGAEPSRFTLNSFKEYQKITRNKKTAIHKLFAEIKNDKEIKETKLLTKEDILVDRLDDEFVIEHFIRPFEQYAFYTPKVDGLGAAYEVLGQLSGKDTRAGQFFTPENIVEFMVKLAELDVEDKVFDPACGTARFLTQSLTDMIDKATSLRDSKTKIKNIKANQLFGVDDDPTVSKLAKMNMYIHGDGKTNIQDKDGLTEYVKDDQIDVILTNPPLGNLDYWRVGYDNEFRLQRMSVIPKKNKTLEKLEKIKKIIDEKQQILKFIVNDAQITRTTKRLEQLQQQKSDLEYIITHNQSEYVTTGKMMKGGALFLNACKYYLKEIRNASEKIEWRGGKMLIILDEGVLNTQEYEKVRDFIKHFFYIKAVISLSKDTFVPVSKTTTKTSILYAIKKEDPDAIQQEPIFFAHADKVGMDTRKKICANDLFNDKNSILSSYFEFKEKINSSYVGINFKKEKFESLGFNTDTLHNNSEIS